ncbi:1943_t:CDS:2 [Gigaspora rosea]|nr:1943_t:CDS:2 [Gigaspora rosea]
MVILREFYKNHKLDWKKNFEYAINICQGIAYLNAVEFRDTTRNIQVNLENVRYMVPEKLEYADKKQYNVKCKIYRRSFIGIAEEEIPCTRLGIDL